MQDNNSSANMVEEESGFDFKALLTKLIIYWKWFVVSIILCLALAVFYLKTTAPVYKVQATVMINDDMKGAYQNPMMALQDFGYMGNSSSIDNEVGVFCSKSLIKQAVIDMGMYVVYQIDNGLTSRVIYGNYPINVEISREDMEAMVHGLTLEIVRPDSLSYTVEYKYRDEVTDKMVKVEKTISHFPYALESPIGTLFLSEGTADPLPVKKKMLVSVVPPIKMAKSCLGSLSVAPTSKTTSLAIISYLDVNKRRGVDFVNSLIDAYNREKNNDKNVVAIKTEEFIKSRLEIVTAELNNTETQMAQFKRTSGLTNLTGDAQKVLEGSTAYEKMSVEVQTQLNLITYLREYVNNPKNDLQVIPANVGLTDASLSTSIGRYNEAVIERNRMLRTATESNPSVIDITTSIRLMASTIKASIESVYDAMTIKQKDVEAQTRKFSSKIGDAPEQEQILAGFMRQQEVKSGLYLMLLQKREENSIALAATADNAKVIDAALPNDFPVSPKGNMILLIALVMGCAIPIVVIYLLELLRYKIEGRTDLEKLTTIPVLGDLAKVHAIIDKEMNRSIVVKENENGLMTEMFRTIRTNLKFILDTPEKKVVMFTSSTPGEGKTFVSSNLAMSIALLGKKVILVGLDIRKPRLAEVFGFSKRAEGITSYLAGDAEDKDLLFRNILNSGLSENLDILPAGIVPPNPSELLAKNNLEYAIKYLSEKYDYILLDTAPIGLMVTDTTVISRVADATVCVCRADYTAKNDIRTLETAYKEQRFPHMALVLNGIDLTKRKYGYYYGYGHHGHYGNYGRYGYVQYNYDDPKPSKKSKAKNK